MRIRRRTRKCLNCQATLAEVYNYCPNCGQENTHNDLSIFLLFKEFFSNYFSLDSRFGRTIKPFLVNPGKLTTSFNEGKRVFYAHPVRLYLVISLIHFSIFAWFNSDENTNEDIVLDIGAIDDESLEKYLAMDRDSIPNDPDNWPLQDWEYAWIKKLQKDGHSDLAILDSLNVDERPYFEAFVVDRILRISDTSSRDLQEQIIQNIPLMMFFILPLYALMLNLFYWRKGRYIHHLIHSIHIHSFTFFALSLSWVFGMVFETASDALLMIPVSGITFYIYQSMRNVYHNKRSITWMKLFTIGFFYTLLLSLATALEVLLSLAFY